MANQQKTILIIDDEFHLLVGVKALLEYEGYKTASTSDSTAGLQMAKKIQPDLIICDVMMPFVDGFKVKEMLSGDPITKNIPFLFLSARASQTDKLRGLTIGADDYITKPFDHRELLARISAVFKRYQKGQDDMRRKMDEELARFEQEVSHNITHELRTPMTQILLALDMALRNKFDDVNELKQFIEIALSQSQKLNGIIDDLIFLNNYDRGIINALRQPVEINVDFLEPLKILRELYSDKNVNMQGKIDPKVSIHAPRREFRRAVTHLVDNACKFSTPMTPVLVDLEENGCGGFILTVTDYGPGIAPQYFEKVFDRFFQIDQGDCRAYNGLGVGLTVAQIFAQKLGGDIIILPSKTGCRMQMVVPPGQPEIP